MKKVLSVLLAVCLIIGCLPMGASALRGERQSGDTSSPKLSKEEIQTLLETNSLALPSSLFDVTPSTQAPYTTGKVKTEALQAACNRLNALRKIAGVPAVTLDMGLCEEAQYGAVILAARGGLSHTPNKPADMDTEFYNKAYAATSSSNIAAGSTLTGSVDNFMADDMGSNNLSSVGHRRWQLNPVMGKVGFGFALGNTSGAYGGRFTTEKVFDESGNGCDYDFISWPASGAFPSSVFDGNVPWSITLNPDKYATPVMKDLTVILKREADGKQWGFIGTKMYSTSQANYFNVDQNGYGGVNSCIIFRPDGINEYDGVYTVEVKGLKTKSGAPVTDFIYSVNFFSTKPAPVKVTGVQLDQTELTLKAGEAGQLSATVAPYNAANKNLTWSTSDNSVASVTSSGKVIAVAEGTATITAKTSDGGYTASCTVTVTANEIPYISGLSIDYYTAQITGNAITVTLPADTVVSNARIYIDVMQNGKEINEGFSLYIDGTLFDPYNRYEFLGSERMLIELVSGDHREEYWLTVKQEGAEDDISFTDVPAGAYYADAVKWAVENNVTAGTDKTHFSPNASCTRAQAVTFLWRAAGKPEPQNTTTQFSDVKAGSYYEKAVQWAVENGVTAGTGKTTFSPNASCTRAQIVTFLYRAENSPEITGNNSFSDVKAGAYYENAVKWAVKNEITTGTGGNKFSPDNNCIRSQIVTFLYRYKK